MRRLDVAAGLPGATSPCGYSANVQRPAKPGAQRLQQVRRRPAGRAPRSRASAAGSTTTRPRWRANTKAARDGRPVRGPAPTPPRARRGRAWTRATGCGAPRALDASSVHSVERVTLASAKRRQRRAVAQQPRRQAQCVGRTVSSSRPEGASPENAKTTSPPSRRWRDSARPQVRRFPALPGEDEHQHARRPRGFVERPVEQRDLASARFHVGARGGPAGRLRATARCRRRRRRLAGERSSPRCSTAMPAATRATAVARLHRAACRRSRRTRVRRRPCGRAAA